MQRFFLPQNNFQNNAIIINDKSIVHQIADVLRMKEDGEFIALDNSGNEFLCRITVLNKNKITAQIIRHKQNEAEPEIFLTLFQALPKKRELFEWILQKGAEIGVGKFVPLITERTERKSLPNPVRLNRILKEAAEQSGRGKIPQLAEITNFKSAVNNEKNGILLDKDRQTELLQNSADKIKKLGHGALFAGPEGGFSANEIDLAIKKGVSVCSLGPRTLRTETAGICGASLILLG